MKIDKKLSEEFGAQLPSPSYLAPTRGERIVELIFGNILWFIGGMALLATGAVIGRYFPAAIWYLFGFVGVGVSCVAALFVVALIACMADDPMEGGNYDGS